MQRTLLAFECLAQAVEGGGIVVIAVDVLQVGAQALEHGRIQAAVVFEAVAHAFAQRVDVARATGHADDRQFDLVVAEERLQGGEDLLVGEVAGGAEKHERVGSLGRSTQDRSFAAWAGGVSIPQTRLIRGCGPQARG